MPLEQVIDNNVDKYNLDTLDSEHEEENDQEEEEESEEEEEEEEEEIDEDEEEDQEEDEKQKEDQESSESTSLNTGSISKQQDGINAYPKNMTVENDYPPYRTMDRDI